VIEGAVINLFIDTSFERAEEDRLTNAWMAVLYHADRSLLARFLALAGVTADAGECTNARFELQVTLANSRLDACITLPDFVVAIETKHTAEFDKDQFERHAVGLQSTGPRSLLVALTGDAMPPPGFDDVSVEGVSTAHVSWHDVTAMLHEYEDQFPAGSATRLLIDQMTRYLAALGYRKRETTTMQELRELTLALRKHRQTIRAAEGTLSALAAQLRLAPGTKGLKWRAATFRPMDFQYLDARVPEATFEARLRIYPNAGESGDLRVRYYLTFWPKAGTEGVQQRLQNAQQELVQKHGTLDACGKEHDGYFRVTQNLPPDVIERMYGVDAKAVQEAARRIGGLFGSLRKLIGR